MANMTTVYKLTNVNAQTHSGCQWGEGVEHTASGEGDLCGPGWLHAYSHPLLAALMSPAHVGWWETARLWEADATIGRNDGTKIGCTRLRTIKQIPMPAVTDEQRIRFAIGSAALVWEDKDFLAWAHRWIAGDDRSGKSAVLAAKAAWAVQEAAHAAAEAAAIGAKVAAQAAAGVGAGWAAVWAAQAAAGAVAGWAVGVAAGWAAGETGKLDFVRIAKWAMSDEPLDCLEVGHDPGPEVSDV